MSAPYLLRRLLNAKALTVITVVLLTAVGGSAVNILVFGSSPLIRTVNALFGFAMGFIGSVALDKWND